ncbi:MAG TPA: SH3 domain-containing protein, partial [Gemmatimonadales bacterium]|nr:SH3 domain-containing protein [Gemmatimonadales bacterium]
DTLLGRIPPRLQRLAGVGALVCLGFAAGMIRPAAAVAQTGVELYMRGEYAAAAHAFRMESRIGAPPTVWYDLAAAEYMARHDPQAVAALLVAREAAPRNRHVEALWNALAREHEQLRGAGVHWPFSADESLALALLLLWLAALLYLLPGKRRPVWIVVLLFSGVAAVTGVSLRAAHAEPRAVLAGGSSLRVSPHGLAPERATVLPFSVVRLERRQGGWWLIETADGAVGWVPADILAPIPALD